MATDHELGTISARGPMLALGALMLGSAFLAGWAPLSFSVATVFLFSGPHNWMEGRYVLTRFPARWGKQRAFFLLGLSGVFFLTGAWLALPLLGWWADWGAMAWDRALALWLSSLVLWIVALVRLNPRRSGYVLGWLAPLGLGFLLGCWVAPRLCGLALVYLHPLLALWILDRELWRRRRAWCRPYRLTLALVPLLVLVLWIRLSGAPPLPGETTDPLTGRIIDHAGALILPGVSSHLLVATHTFLEMIHYGVWIVAIPLLALPWRPWRLERIPLAAQSFRGRWLVGGVLAVGALVSILLWIGYSIDYSTTRDLYFALAVAHVLAEIPLLLRSF